MATDWLKALDNASTSEDWRRACVILAAGIIGGIEEIRDELRRHNELQAKGGEWMQRMAAAVGAEPPRDATVLGIVIDEPDAKRVWVCRRCERGWDNPRDLEEHVCSRAPADHECDCESTAQVHSREECASQRDELAPRSGALEPGETTDGPKRSGG